MLKHIDDAFFRLKVMQAPAALVAAGVLQAIVRRAPLDWWQRVEHLQFWYGVSDERAMDRVHESRAARRTT